MHALEDITVVDLAGTISTSYCGKLFADYGARVINVEPDEGFSTRKLAPFIDGESAMHAYLHTDKLSVLRDRLEPSRLKDIVRTADLVLNDGRDLPAEPNGVNSSITWYGTHGPYKDFTGTDAQCFALNGMLRMVGHEAGPPLLPTGYQAQIVGGMTAFIASMTEVLGRELGNVTQARHIHTSIFEAMLCFTESGAVGVYNTGLQSPRLGINRFVPTYPLGVFPCKDGWIGLTVLTPSQWHAFCDLLDMPDIKDVPLFQTSIGRLEAVDIIEPLIRERLLEHSAEQLFYTAQKAKIPLARVPTLEELFSVDQFVERRAFAEAQLPTGKALVVPSVPFRLFDTPPILGGGVAQLGEHDSQLGLAND